MTPSEFNASLIDIDFSLQGQSIEINSDIGLDLTKDEAFFLSSSMKDALQDALIDIVEDRDEQETG